MREQDGEQIQQLLKGALRLSNTELNRDLWPEMLRRLDEGQVRLPWSDWALIALVAIWCLLFPGAVFGLLYHL